MFSGVLRLSIVSVLFAVLVLWLVGSSESFKECIHHSKNNEAYHALHEEVGLLVKSFTRVKLTVACARLTASENDGAITALATVLVAGFTCTLWWATSGLVSLMANQTKLTESLLALEQPYLFVVDIGTVSWSPRDGWMHEEQFVPSAEIQIANYGRTPATLSHIRGTIHSNERLTPERPDMRMTNWDFHQGIVPADETKRITFTITGIPHAGRSIDALLKIRLIAYGGLVYLDVFGNRIESRFGFDLPDSSSRGKRVTYTAYNRRIVTKTEDRPENDDALLR